MIRHMPQFSRHTAAHRKLWLLLGIIGWCILMIGCLWNSVGRWIFLGALLVLVPLAWSALSVVLDIELRQDRTTMPGRRPRGRHHGSAFFDDRNRPAE